MRRIRKTGFHLHDVTELALQLYMYICMLAGPDTGRMRGEEGSRATGISFYPENWRRLCPKTSPRHVGYMVWNEIFDLQGHQWPSDGTPLLLI